MKALPDERVKSNTQLNFREEPDLDYSSFEEDIHTDDSTHSNSVEPSIIFTQNPYYDQTEGAAASNSNDQEKTFKALVVFTQNPYYE